MQAVRFAIAVIMIPNLEASANLAPLYRLNHSKNGDHFYTTSIDEAMNAVHTFSYIYEGQAGLVSTTASDCQLKPVYRLLNQRNDHFYTTNDLEASQAALNGYVREGIAFYCAASANECSASAAFHRYVVGGSDHFYTINIDEGFNVVKNGGKYEGIMCYIWS